MSPQHSRRVILQTTGGMLAAGLAGCTLRKTATETPTGTPPSGEETPGGGGATESSDDDEDPTPGDGTTYGIVVRNQLEPDDFDDVSELSGPKPAIVDLRVSDLAPSDEEAYFETTVELASGESKQFPEAFTVRPDGPTYAMSAKLEPFITGGLSYQDYRRAGLTFRPGGDRVPSVNPIPINVYSVPDSEREGLYPSVTIGAHSD